LNRLHKPHDCFQQEIQANVDDYGVVVYTLPEPVPGVTSVRIVPRTWHGGKLPSLRADVVGCHSVITETTMTITTTTSGEVVITTEKPVTSPEVRHGGNALTERSVKQIVRR